MTEREDSPPSGSPSVETPPPGVGGRTAALVLTLFVLSGAAGLIYEIIWTRMLTLVFGNTVHAASTVVAAFMGGLALGSFYFGRLADRRRDTLRLYGLLEVGVGVFALLMPLILQSLNSVYTGLFRAFGEQPAPFFIARFLLSFTLLLIPTILMGATLPVLTRFFVSQRERLGRQVANLYALNTLGATVGCFAAGFLLIERLGVEATNYLAAATSLAVAASILSLARRLDRGRRPAVPQRETAPPAGAKKPLAAGERYSARLRHLILVSVALVGFTSLAYEVIWMRVIVYVVSASIEAFAIVLTTFLAGIALGSLLVARWVDRWRRLVGAFGAIEIAIGLAAVASIPLLAHLYQISAFVSQLVRPGFWSWTAVRFTATALVIAVPTLLMGAAFPVATNGFIRTVRRVGQGVGGLYAMNTVGAVAGSLAAGFLILPAVGAQKGLMILSLLNLVVGVILWCAEPGRRFPGVAGAVAVAAVGYAAGLAFIPPHSFHRLFNQSRPESRLVYCSEGVTATVTVHEFPDMRLICTNGVNVAGTDYMLRTTQMLQAHLPLMFQRPQPRVMQVGFGSGETSRAVLLQGVERLDVVEICPGLVRAAPLFADINGHVYRDSHLNPRFNMIFMDAKNYALLTAETYDIIMNDSIHPRVSGAASLYTVDYFEDCRRHLAPGGIMTSWLPIYGMRVEELRMILRSFQTVFPHATLWMAHNVVNRHTVLLGPVDDAPLRIDYQEFSRRISRPDVAADLSVIEMSDPAFFLTTLLMDEDALFEFSQGGELNTDEHPLLEYRVPKYTGDDELTWAANLEAMIPYRSDVRPLLANLPRDSEAARELWDQLGRFYESTEYVFRGMVKGLRGDPSAVEEFLTAGTIAPEHLGVRIALGRREDLLRRRMQEAEARAGDAEAHARLADAFWRAGRLVEAARELERAASLDSENPEIARRLGDIRRALGDPGAAAVSYRRSLALRPDNLETMAGLAAALESAGESAEAADLYRRAAALDTRRTDLQLRLGMVEDRMGHAEEATAAYRHVLRRNPHSVEALNNLALLEAAGGNRDEAVALYRRALEADPRHPDAWNNLAWLYAEEGTDLEEAVRLAERAVELDPSAPTFDTLAWVRFRRGDLDEAHEAILKALELAPREQACLEHLRLIEEARRRAQDEA